MWIETCHINVQGKTTVSRPTRACGLKHCVIKPGYWSLPVAPHAGVWIETLWMADMLLSIVVAPHAGVWIETQT